jgi:N-acetylglucosamine-6-sulfatase
VASIRLTVRSRGRVLRWAIATLLAASFVWVTADTPNGSPLAANASPLPLSSAPSGPHGAPGATPTRTSSPRPNIVLINTDDQRWDTLWAMPVVRRTIVDRGVTFSNSFVVNALCCPSRASILTGNYSHTTGVYGNRRPHGGFNSFRDRSTIAVWLHRDGYHTALVGKYLNLYPGGYVPPGWSWWNAIVMNPELGNYYYNYPLSIGTHVVQYGDAPRDYSTNVLANRAVRFIESRRGPIFLYFAPWAPHKPAIPAPGDGNSFGSLRPFRPPNYNERDVSDKPEYLQRLPMLDASHTKALDLSRRRQYQSLLAVDRAVGRIEQALRQTGRLKNTMIVYTSDNGLAWGEHRWTNKQAPYEESMRVPLVIRYPPFGSSARTVRKMALNIDIAPTLAHLAGVSTGSVDGRSLLPHLRGTPTPWRSDFLIEHLDTALPRVPTHCAVRAQHELFVVYASGTREYYDLRRDPFELQNRARDPQTDDTRRVLRARLHELCNPPPPGMRRP